MKQVNCGSILLTTLVVILAMSIVATYALSQVIWTQRQINHEKYSDSEFRDLELKLIQKEQDFFVDDNSTGILLQDDLMGQTRTGRLFKKITVQNQSFSLSSVISKRIFKDLSTDEFYPIYKNHSILDVKKIKLKNRWQYAILKFQSNQLMVNWYDAAWKYVRKLSVDKMHFDNGCIMSDINLLDEMNVTHLHIQCTSKMYLYNLTNKRWISVVNDNATNYLPFALWGQGEQLNHFNLLRVRQNGKDFVLQVDKAHLINPSQMNMSSYMLIRALWSYPKIYGSKLLIGVLDEKIPCLVLIDLKSGLAEHSVALINLQINSIETLVFLEDLYSDAFGRKIKVGFDHNGNYIKATIPFYAKGFQRESWMQNYQ